MGKKKIMAIAAIIIFLISGTIVGYASLAKSRNPINAMKKVSEVQTIESKSNINLKIDVKDLPEEEIAQLANVLPMLQDINLKVDTKSVKSADTKGEKHQIDISAALGGMAVNTGIWVDMNTGDKNTSVKEIVKIPEILAAQFGGKQYAVIDSGKIPGINMQKVDYKQLMEQSKNIQLRVSETLQDYIKESKANIVKYNGLHNVTTQDGKMLAFNYEVKLTDADLKAFTRYAVIHLSKDKEFMNELKSYLLTIVEMSGASTAELQQSKSEIEKGFADFDKNNVEFLKNFNKFMDAIKDVKILSDKGIDIKYAVNLNGYLVNQSGVIDFELDAAKLNELDQKMGGTPENADSVQQGVLKITADFDTNLFNINKDVKIDIPKTDTNNSFNLDELMGE